MADTTLPENWMEILHTQYGLLVTVNNDLKGYDHEGKFYWDEEDMTFLSNVFSELMKLKLTKQS